MPEEPRLPIKVVVPDEGDFRKPEGGGAARKIFGEVTPQVRSSLADQVRGVRSHFSRSLRAKPRLACVARVLLRRDALAKCHRPASLFSARTCPIIGVRTLGELLVSVSSSGLQRLANKIQRDHSKTGTANISTVERIEPYTSLDALGKDAGEGLRASVAERKSCLKLRLFNHLSPAKHDEVVSSLRDVIQECSLPAPEPIRYAEGMYTYRLQGVAPPQVDRLASFVGTQSRSTFPTYRVVKTVSTPVRPIAEKEFPLPDPREEYPVVGVVDTGTDPGDPALSPWVVAREEYVPETESDHSHGSFVTGLIVHGRRANDDRFPAASAKIVDVAAIPKGGITDYELLTILEEVLPKYPQVRYWNLSLATEDPCVEDAFSDLAIGLDRLQDQHDVTFVISAGNYVLPPLRGRPPGDLGEADRLSPPADSVRAIAVGSMAHLQRPGSRVNIDEPSPFSRRGPGPVFLPKPELTHYGGNCNANGDYAQTGILSFDGRGNLAEDIGTSFSTPLITSVLANVHGGLRERPSRNLARALTVHSAFAGSGDLTTQSLKYRGFGMPPDVPVVLTCVPWAVTLVFETELRAGLEFEKAPFPIPHCLRSPDGKVFGEFLMTLVYDPPLDPNCDSEYCRTNVEASLGTYDADREGQPRHHKVVPAEPRDLSLLYERHLIEHGFKWSPVKVYRRRISRGVRGDVWRLKVSVHHRSGFMPSEAQSVALLVTMIDHRNRGPVYDETVNLMSQLQTS